MKIHIIGAGPAGTISAISALNSGFDVTISEKNPESGSQISCSGLISKSGLDSLSKYINYKKLVENSFNGAIIDFCGVQFVVEKKTNIAFKINRKLFDYQLVENAIDEGAKINYNEKIKNKFYSCNIIGADGPLSSTADFFNFPKIKKFVCTAQAKIRYTPEDHRKVMLFYSNSLFPGFFGWLIPINEDYSEIGCGSVLPQNPKKGLNHIIKKFKSHSKKTTFSIIPITTREKTGLVYNRRNILLVGDAAGQTKATTGGGIVFGGNCASIAGRNADNPINYEREWRKEFGFDLSVHSLIQSFLEGRSDSDLKNLGIFLNSSKIDTYLSKNGDMDRPSKMINANLIAYFAKNFF
ncbi:MAG: NAD(P)/FAD-dependent oxidoreductase [Candidatus ainarchaeum sp.]|nr:NAD(P)/FAD-dependent oxidoreductase [Candidatus ainarchaeum sp.]